MNTRISKQFAVVTALAAAALLAVAAPAQAHGRVQWSVTVGSPTYYPPPGVVMVPQSEYIYGAPPAAFAPPPVIYVQPQPVYMPPPVMYYDPYSRQYGPRHEHRNHGRHERNGWDNPYRR